MFFFNIFINDLFLQIKTVQLNLYADDGQLYTSKTDPVSLETRISREVSSANAWYEINGVIANLSKHREMILGKTDHQFNFSVNDSMELFGVTIDKIGKLISTETMLRPIGIYASSLLLLFYDVAFL